jgi:hypothetical protein
MWLQLVYRCLPSLSDGETVFAHACKLRLEGIVSKRKGSMYRSGPLARLAQDEEPGGTGSEARRRGRLELETGHRIEL